MIEQTLNHQILIKSVVVVLLFIKQRANCNRFGSTSTNKRSTHNRMIIIIRMAKMPQQFNLIYGLSLTTHKQTNKLELTCWRRRRRLQNNDDLVSSWGQLLRNSQSTHWKAAPLCYSCCCCVGVAQRAAVYNVNRVVCFCVYNVNLDSWRLANWSRVSTRKSYRQRFAVHTTAFACH